VQPTRPLSKATALEWEIDSTFWSQEQHRHLVHRLSEDNWLATTAESYSHIPVQPRAEMVLLMLWRDIDAGTFQVLVDERPND
jgi:hypothetical protein